MCAIINQKEVIFHLIHCVQTVKNTLPSLFLTLKLHHGTTYRIVAAQGSYPHMLNPNQHTLGKRGWKCIAYTYNTNQSPHYSLHNTTPSPKTQLPTHFIEILYKQLNYNSTFVGYIYRPRLFDTDSRCSRESLAYPSFASSNL